VTTKTAGPSARVVSGPAFELIAELAAFASGPARASLESGKMWIREVRRLAGPDLTDRVEGWAFAVWTELASIALDAGPPYDPATIPERLRADDPDALYRRFLGADSAANRAMVSEGAFERALDGDRDARAELRRALGVNAPARLSLDRLFATAPAEVQEDVAQVVEAWTERVFPAFRDEALAILERDLETKRRLFRDTPIADALRTATGGVEFSNSWASEIVVVPTVALRPFIAAVDTMTTAIVLCSVGDEAFDDDPTAPPRKLVQVAAALGDELRLRILHELADGDRTAKQLASRLRVDRTSLHHHLGILRSAGLVAVHAVGVQTWTYSLRGDGIATASASLASYLGSRTRSGGPSATQRNGR
jgi:DNA-binding HxlR family transcriptional regulator